MKRHTMVSICFGAAVLVLGSHLWAAQAQPFGSWTDQQKEEFLLQGELARLGGISLILGEARAQFIQLIRQIGFRFLLIGRRTNLDVIEPLDFRGDWVNAILRRAESEGRLEAPWGSDFFAFPKGSGFAGIPRFAVGRPNWDNWMIAFASKLTPSTGETKATGCSPLRASGRPMTAASLTPGN